MIAEVTHAGSATNSRECLINALFMYTRFTLRPTILLFQNYPPKKHCSLDPQILLTKQH